MPHERHRLWASVSRAVRVPNRVDEAQISQVIENLVINADQAMKNGGVVRVKAENVIIGEEDNIAGLSG